MAPIQAMCARSEPVWAGVSGGQSVRAEEGSECSVKWADGAEADPLAEQSRVEWSGVGGAGPLGSESS